MEFKCKKPSIEPSVSQLSSNSQDSVSSETVKRPRRSVVREDSLMTHDQMVAKWMENPEFRKVVFELDAQYAALDKALTKGKPNCLEQATTQENEHHSIPSSSVRKGVLWRTSISFRRFEKASALLKIFKRQKTSCLAMSSKQLENQLSLRSSG